MSKLVLDMFDENDKIIKTEYYNKLTEISKKYDINYASLFAICDDKHLTKSRLSKKTTELTKRFKIYTKINNKITDAIADAIHESKETLVDLASPSPSVQDVVQ
jgi:predicted Holliday junction resolvase-like endonuclease